jgi:hypothetical protein
VNTNESANPNFVNKFFIFTEHVVRIRTASDIEKQLESIEILLLHFTSTIITKKRTLRSVYPQC